MSERHGAEGTRAGLVVLVVDDDAQARAVLRRMLERMGAAVIEAVEGDEALAVAAARRVDVALVDLLMPGREGIATLDALKRSHPSVRRVAMTGSVHAALYLKMARQLGAHATLEKPIGLEALQRALGVLPE